MSEREGGAGPMMDRERILFVTSNGTGLGHLTRSMAIARRLGPEVEPLFFTLSEAASVVREVGFAVEYMASHGGPTAAWRREARTVAPIVFSRDEEILPRAEAERELGLEPGMTNVLVQLGQGAEVGPAAERCLRALAGRDAVQVAAASSTIATLLDVAPGVVGLGQNYPMSR